MKILTDSAIIVNRVATLLDEQNISSHIKNNLESARVAGYGVPQNSVELYVYRKDAERAQEVIEEFKKESAS